MRSKRCQLLHCLQGWVRIQPGQSQGDGAQISLQDVPTRESARVSARQFARCPRQRARRPPEAAKRMNGVPFSTARIMPITTASRGHAEW